jgi:DNA-binding GntR family transcriptional regulator
VVDREAEMSSSDLDRTAVSRIYKELRRSIILGRRHPGTRLSVEILSEQYGTSITPVREALQMLSREGLVTAKPHAGFFVTLVTLKQLRDMLELREILEVASVERAARRITDEQLAELGRVHAGYSGDDDESYDRYMAENRRFHYLIALASGNRELAEALGHLLDRLTRFLVVVHTGDVIETIHQRLLDALRSHDVARARQTILDELTETRESTLEHVIQEAGGFWTLGAPTEAGPPLTGQEPDVMRMHSIPKPTGG